MKSYIKTSHGIALLASCLVLFLIFISWASKQINSYVLFVPVPPSSQVAAVSDFADALVVHYTFDEGSGTTAGESSGNGNTGTLTNGPVWVEGKVGSGALSFDGTNDYINAGTGANITGAITVSAWFKKMINSGGSKTLVARGTILGTPSAEQYALFFPSYDITIPRFSVSNGTTRIVSVAPASSVPNGVWNHIVGTYNGADTTRLYVNGTQVDTDTTASFGLLNSTPNPNALGIGAIQNGAAGWFNGPLDDVRIYNRALSVSEVSDLYALGSSDTSTYILTVTKQGTGSGTVTGIGINCGSDCAETQNQGTSITLTASPVAGSIFQGWSGGACTGTGTCTVTLNANTTITATFNTQTVGGSGTYSVKQDGSGDFTTIQACANVVTAGGTCLVYPGNYPERVMTKAGGTSSNPSSCIPVTGTFPNLVPNSATCDAQRITFKANGLVTVQAFWISNPYVTVDGFDITGYATVNLGHIIIAQGGDFCQVINNVIRDGAVGVYGIKFYLSSATIPAANNCTFRGNTFRNLNGTFFQSFGANHLFENNALERVNNRDYLYVFGHDILFRRNIFRDGNAVAGVGNHPDWVQTFGDNGSESYNMLFEENWIENLETQLGQIDGGGGARGISLVIHDWLFRRNAFINISNYLGSSVKGMRMEHNTFYRMAYTQSGISTYSTLSRGDSSGTAILSNAFVAGGSTPTIINDIRGFYSLGGASLGTEPLRYFATNGDDTIATTIAYDLKNNGYTNGPNGDLTNKARSLTDISQFVIGDAYASYKNTVYDLLTRTVQLDQSARATIIADYNFVAGAAPAYPVKATSGCSAGIFGRYYFCETHGINGGNPRFYNESDPDGPDNIPFTLDDGLKPLPGSPLCGRGEGGTDIGAYSCDPTIVFAGGSSGDGFPPPSPVPGSCSTTPNQCTAGTFSDTTDTPTQYLWNCTGSNGGITASCSLPIATTPTTGDFNNDSIVNSIDLSLMITAWNTSNTTYDLNRDGRVNSLDYVMMVRNWTV